MKAVTRVRCVDRFRQSILILAILLYGVGPGPGLPDTAFAQTEELQQSVTVRGNRRIEAETILSYMNIEPGQTVTAQDLNTAVRTLFDTGLFRDVQIVPEDGRLIVEVVENPSISVIAFEGNSTLTDDDLNQIINLRPRLPFTVSAAEADAAAILEVYRSTGRYGALVEPIIIERSDNRVDLVFEIDEGEQTGVSSIDFVGNQVFSDRRLRGVIDTTESGLFSFIISSDVYDPNRLELDKELLREYYLERGYADFSVLSATAELSPDRDGFFITFVLDEGEAYDFGDLDVAISAPGLTEEDFVALLPTDLTGDTYDATAVEEIANDLTDLAGQQGFAFVRVRPEAQKRTDEQIIDITFQLAEGQRVFIERIDIEGNNATLDRVIRRNIDLVEGDAFDARKIRDARSKIRGLGFFSAVNVETRPGSADDRAVLKVQVEEQSTGSLTFGIGFSTSDGPVGNVALTERNFLGRGQRLNLEVTAAGAQQIYDASFTEPAFLDRDLAVGFRAFYLDDDNTNESAFQLRRLGLTPSVEFPLGEDTRLSLGYSVLFDDISVEFDASPVIQADEGDRLTSLVEYTVLHDKRNDVIEPTAGYLLTIGQEFAGLGGDARYVNTRATAQTWFGFFDDEVLLSLGSEVGAIVGFGDDVRINERYFLGGSNLRGFASEGAGPRDLVTDDSLGGNILARARAELTFPIGLPEEFGIFGGLFVDAGTLYKVDGALLDANGNPIDDSANLRVGAGGLLFIATPFGPLELSLGTPILKEDGDAEELFRLSIGTRF